MATLIFCAGWFCQDAQKTWLTVTACDSWGLNQAPWSRRFTGNPWCQRCFFELGCTSWSSWRQPNIDLSHDLSEVLWYKTIHPDSTDRWDIWYSTLLAIPLFQGKHWVNQVSSFLGQNRLGSSIVQYLSNKIVYVLFKDMFLRILMPECCFMCWSCQHENDHFAPANVGRRSYGCCLSPFC